jgi:hypothetical protein
MTGTKPKVGSDSKSIKEANQTSTGSSSTSIDAMKPEDTPETPKKKGGSVSH